MKDYSGTLAEFSANLRYEQIPEEVIHHAMALFLDWFGCALSGKGEPAVEAIAGFARQMGAEIGGSEVLIHRRRTSPFFAAMVNAAASHVMEQDDVHPGAIFHPGAVVFPAALAIAQQAQCSGQEFLAAVVAGYEVGVRAGEYLGRPHYKVFHTTGTAGTLAAAAAAARLMRLSADQTLDAFGSAGTQAAGLWEFLRDAADSKPLHVAHAAGCGLMSACLAAQGVKGARRILEGEQGMAAGMLAREADPAALVDGLGSRWALLETSFKWHASCRHTHPAADALLHVMQEHALGMEQIDRIVAHVHQGALDVLIRGDDIRSVQHAKFSMGIVLAMIGRFGAAGVSELHHHFDAPFAREWCNRVSLAFDEEVDKAYPQRWIGKITVHTYDGRTLIGRVDVPRGDPGNALTTDMLCEKALRLAEFSRAANAVEMQVWCDQILNVQKSVAMPYFFSLG